MGISAHSLTGTLQPLPEYDFTQGKDELQSFRLVELARPTGYNHQFPHRHKYFELFVFKKGGGSHMIDFSEFPIQDSSIHFVFPGQVHRVNRGEASEGFVFLFPESLLSSPVSEFWNSPTLVFDEGAFALLLSLVENIKQEIAVPSSESMEIIRHFLGIFLLKCKQAISSSNQKNANESEPITGQFRALLEKNFRTLRQVSDYASALNVTPDHLTDEIKKHLGQTASRMIQNRILLEAQRLLHHSPLSTKEIGFYLGFDDPAYFNRFFKKETGTTPGQFRDDSREKYKLKPE